MDTAIGQGCRFGQPVNILEVAISQPVGPDSAPGMGGANLLRMNPRRGDRKVLVAGVQAGVGPEAVEPHGRVQRDRHRVAQRNHVGIVGRVALDPLRQHLRTCGA